MFATNEPSSTADSGLLNVAVTWPTEAVFATNGPSSTAVCIGYDGFKQMKPISESHKTMVTTEGGRLLSVCELLRELAFKYGDLRSMGAVIQGRVVRLANKALVVLQEVPHQTHVWIQQFTSLIIISSTPPHVSPAIVTMLEFIVV